MHQGHAHHGELGVGPILILGLAMLLVGLYLVAAARGRRRGRRWSVWRTSAFLLGAAVVIAALVPPLAPLGHSDLRAHMVQHMLLGMIGPIGIVLGAPATLALRSLSAPAARGLVAALRSRPVHLLAHPATALVLNIGGMAVLYTTPLYAALATRPWLHAAVHFHFLAAGCLFSWSIVGTDPGPARPSHAARLFVLVLAMAAHATVAKAMYAYGWPPGSAHPLSEIEQAAKLMYYGGDLAELLLAVALFAGWRKAGRTGARPLRRGPAHTRRTASPTRITPGCTTRALMPRRLRARPAGELTN